MTTRGLAKTRFIGKFKRTGRTTYWPILNLIPLLVLMSGMAACAVDGSIDDQFDSPSNPKWVADAVFYQIFPTRFRNGDSSNDPDRSSLEFPENVPAHWEVSSWTADWYARADWEVSRGEDFYEDGVFDRRYGGDLQGVIDKLDYLKDLGITSLYFNPVFYARSLHKYDGNTFHHIDPHFGPDPKGDFELMGQETSDPSTWHVTAADQLFFDLVAGAHQRNMRVVIDGVWNHTGRDFFAFEDIRENQQASPYKDWYIIQSFDDPSTPENEFAYEGWWGVETLPLFADTEDGNDLHPGPKQYIFDATRRWMDPNGDGDAGDGIDGWRLDVAPDVPIKFWADWNGLVRALNPEAYTVSEVWHEASNFLQEGGFSATMNYHAFAFPVKGFLIDNLISASEFTALIDERRQEFPVSMQFAMQNLVDGHDTDRLASMIVNARPVYAIPERFDYDHDVSPRGYEPYSVQKPGARDRKIQKLVALTQMTSTGAPMIYYGTEAGMWGADDPDDRMPMVWEDLTYDDQTTDPRGRPRTQDAVGFDRDIFDFYKSAIKLRKDHKVLRRGGQHTMLADDEANLVVFARSLYDEMLVVVLNRSDVSQSVDLSANSELQGKSITFIYSTTEEGRSSASGISFAEGLQLDVPALTGLVFSAR